MASRTPATKGQPKASSPSSRSTGARGSASGGTRKASNAKAAARQGERAAHDRINEEGSNVSSGANRKR